MPFFGTVSFLKCRKNRRAMLLYVCLFDELRMMPSGKMGIIRCQKRPYQRLIKAISGADKAHITCQKRLYRMTIKAILHDNKAFISI